MNIRHVKVLAALSVVATLAVASAPPLQAQTGTVRCESRGADREQCAIERGARVELARHLSETPCRENGNWGVGPGYIWVSGGCRAEFAVTRRATPNPGAGWAGDSGTTRTTCESKSAERRECRIPAGSRIRLVRQLSQSPCRLNDTYGQGLGYLWVAKGCRGEFEMIRSANANASGGNGGKPTRVVCEAKTGVAGRTQCAAPGATGVRLLKEYSTRRCVLDRTYGASDSYIWTSGGCRGEFEVR